MKRLAIVGRGTVGCLALVHFLRWTNFEIDWIFDPNIEPTAVGEGTTLQLPKSLRENISFDSSDLDAISSTPKLGIWKRNWGAEGKEFHHSFLSGTTGIHFNAVQFQNYIFDKFHNHPRIRIVEGNFLDYENLDCDYVLVCTGSPKELDEYNIHTSIPVNSCVVFQCPWDNPTFLYSATFAKKYGWVFGIPLQNRCSIGYLHDGKMNTEEEIKEDVKDIIDEFKLTPAIQRKISFRNYSKKVNFTGKVVYNGNSSFFLEPLEATSTGFADWITRAAYEVWHGHRSVKSANLDYNRTIDHTEAMIALHYFAGSKFDTPFWKNAEQLATEKLKETLKDEMFLGLILKALNHNNPYYYPEEKELGSWSLRSYVININNLGIKDKLQKLINEIK